MKATTETTADATNEPTATKIAGPDRAAYVSRVRDAYVAAMSNHLSRQSGRRTIYRPPASYDGTPEVTVSGRLVLRKAKKSVWGDLAEFLIDADLQPEAYFEFALGRGRKTPKALQDVATVAEFRDSQFDLSAILRRDLELQKGRFGTLVRIELRRGRSPVDAAYASLRLDDHQLTPLFRFSAATQFSEERFSSLAAALRRAAIEQYLMHPRNYREAWAGFVDAVANGMG